MPRKNWHSLPEYQTLRVMMESQTTAAAARRMGLSQSAVSRSLASLEDRIGRTLFDRDAGRLQPTAAAAQLNSRLDALFAALDRIDGPNEVEREHLSVIAPPTFANQFLAKHIASFLEAHPDCLLTLEYGSSEDATEAVRLDRFDLGVVGVDQTRAGTRLVPFRRAVPVVAMPADHRLAKQSRIEAADLHGEDLIAQSYRFVRRSQLEKLFTGLGVKPKIVAEMTSSVAAVELVRAGLGVAVVNPFPIALHDTGGLVFRPFPSAISYLSYFVTPEDRPVSQLARHFMRHVRLRTPKDVYSESV